MFAKLATSGALATVAVLSLGSPQATAATARTITVTDNQKDSRTVTLHPGDTLLFKLSQCDASCGYTWSQTSAPNQRIVQSGTVATSQGHGANHVRTFRYTARRLGKTIAKFGYFGPGRNKAERTISMTFNVTK